MFDKMKKPGQLSDMEKDAKMSVLDQIKALCEGKMGDNLKNMKSVTVEGQSPEELTKGLSLAKDLMGKPTDDADISGGGDAVDASPALLAGHHDEDAADDMHDDMSEDEINAKLEKLMALKEKMKAKA